jgi:hypothetical protein
MHPVQYEAAYPAHQNRLTVFFRLILAIPQLFVGVFWGLAAGLVTVVAWFAILITGSYPEGMWRFCSGYLRFGGRVQGYLSLQNDPWPAIAADEPGYPVQLSLERPVRQSRLTVAFRLILGIPAFLIASILASVLRPLLFVVWLIVVVTESQPEAMHSFVAFCLRFELRTEAYGMLLVDAYPSFTGSVQASATHAST